MTTTSTSSMPFGKDTADRIAGRLTAVGLELCHMGWSAGRRGTLLLTIDRPGGVTLDDCEAASRAASEILDPLEAELPAYVLEVESPGLDRPLWSLEDCEKFRGRRVTVRLATKIEGTSKLKGVLENVHGESLTVLDEDRHRRYTVRFGDVKIARLVPDL